MTHNLIPSLRVVIVVMVLFASGYAQPVKKEWIVQMWSNPGTRSLIEPQVKNRGIAFLPTDSVRLDMQNKHGMTPEFTRLLARNFARNLTFMVCRFSCDNCGSSTSDVDSFNQVVLDAATYEKQLNRLERSEPLFDKMLYPSLGPEQGPSTGMTSSAIVVFVTGHVARVGPQLRITARMSYADRGFDPLVLGTKVFTSGKTESQLKEVSRQIARWSLGVLRDETR